MDYMTPAEKAEFARIEARRQRDRERVERLIMNPAQRTMGVDMGAIQAQIDAKAARKAAEKEAERQEYLQQQAMWNQLERMDYEQKLSGQGNERQDPTHWDEQIKQKQHRLAREKAKDDRLARESYMEFAGEDRYATIIAYRHPSPQHLVNDNRAKRTSQFWRSEAHRAVQSVRGGGAGGRGAGADAQMRGQPAGHASQPRARATHCAVRACRRRGESFVV